MVDAKLIAVTYPFKMKMSLRNGGGCSRLILKASAAISWPDRPWLNRTKPQTQDSSHATMRWQHRQTESAARKKLFAATDSAHYAGDNAISLECSLHTSQPTLSETNGPVLGLFAAHAATDVGRAVFIETCAPCCVSWKGPAAATLCGRSLRTCRAQHTAAQHSNQVPGMGLCQQVLCSSRANCERLQACDPTLCSAGKCLTCCSAGRIAALRPADSYPTTLLAEVQHCALLSQLLECSPPPAPVRAHQK